MIRDRHKYAPIKYGGMWLRVRWVGLTSLRLQDNTGGNYAFSKALYWQIFYNV